MKNNQNISMTNCHKGGIKIKNNGTNAENPFANVTPIVVNKNINMIYDTRAYEKLDLNINSYSREELFTLFGLKNMSLTEDILKDCKKIVLKTHPDKSRLDEKYFIFFSTAYKKLCGIYEFQNKSNSKKIGATCEYDDQDKVAILDRVFETKKNLKEPKNFNKWFNDQFETHKTEDPNDTGYGGWLKSDEDIDFSPNVSKANMAAEMEKRKKHVQTLSTYKGVNDNCSSTFGGSSLMSYDSNFSSGSLFSSDGMGYTDLRQAYVESVIPVTEDDYNKTKRFKNVDEYKRYRDSVNTVPLSKEESMRQLWQENHQKDEESAALAFYYAEQSEKSQKKQDSFWAGLKQVTN
jgi:hypothetical protein